MAVSHTSNGCLCVFSSYDFFIGVTFSPTVVPGAFMVDFKTFSLIVTLSSPPPRFQLSKVTTHNSLMVVTSLMASYIPTMMAHSFTLDSSSLLPSLLTMINIGNYFSSLMVRDIYYA